MKKTYVILAGVGHLFLKEEEDQAGHPAFLEEGEGLLFPLVAAEEDHRVLRQVDLQAEEEVRHDPKKAVPRVAEEDLRGPKKEDLQEVEVVLHVALVDPRVAEVGLRSSGVEVVHRWALEHRTLVYLHLPLLFLYRRLFCRHEGSVK